MKHFPFLSLVNIAFDLDLFGIGSIYIVLYNHFLFCWCWNFICSAQKSDIILKFMQSNQLAQLNAVEMVWFFLPA